MQHQRSEEHEDAPGDEKARLPPSKTRRVPQTKETRLEYLNRLARGEVDGSDSSDDSDSDESDIDAADTSSSEDGEDYDETEHHNPLQVQEEEVGLIEDATHRLAIQNCDWNNVRAEDLM